MLEVKLYRRDGTSAGKAGIPDARAFPAWVSIREWDKSPREGGKLHTVYFKRQGDLLRGDSFHEAEYVPGEEVIPAVIVEAPSDDEPTDHPYRELRFVFRADATHVYARLTDGLWHFKAFAASKSLDGILAEMKAWEGYGDDPAKWPIQCP